MTIADTTPLAQTIREIRLSKGYSASRLAKLCGVPTSTLTRIESAQPGHSPKPKLLAKIAHALGLPASELFTAANWLQEEDMPSLRAYIRCKYGGDLPDEAIQELEENVHRIRQRYHTINEQ